MTYRIWHATTYLYSEPVTLAHNQAHLEPRATPSQRLLRHELSIRPEPRVMANRADYFGNPLAFFSIQDPYSKLVIEAESEVELTGFGEDASNAAGVTWEEARDAARQSADVMEFLFASPLVRPNPYFRRYAEPSFTPGRPLVEAVADLNRRIHSDFRYVPESTQVDTPVEKAFAERKGVCQDFAHVMIASLRSLGIPARYVSGYIPSTAQSVGADASHAWAAVFCPGIGWAGFDPTNNAATSNSHVTLGWGRDYSDIPPIKGVMLGGGEHIVRVAVSVEPEGGLATL